MFEGCPYNLQVSHSFSVIVQEYNFSVLDLMGYIGNSTRYIILKVHWQTK